MLGQLNSKASIFSLGLLAEKSLASTRSQRYGTRRGILEGKTIGFTIRQ
jgi:hypothetical protein